jgi:excisionase family DNA binding protein
MSATAPTTTPVGERTWLTMEQAADYLGVSLRTIKNLRLLQRHNRFPSTKRAGRVLIHRGQLDAWMLEKNR